MTPGFSELAAIRLGHGLSPHLAAPGDEAGVLASVARACRPDGLTAAIATAAFEELTQARRARTQGQGDDAEVARVTRSLTERRLALLRGRLARAVDAPAGFGERLVQFWSDHFTTVTMNPAQSLMTGAFVDEAIRPFLDRPFSEMLAAATTHPAMLGYLNQTTSVGPNSVRARRRADKRFGLNENLGRELLELHTLGVGASYSQTDVRELAELLTGLTHDPGGVTQFDPRKAEPGAEQVLGRSYGGQGTDGMDEIRRALGDLAVAPDTARHLARKLAVHFAADDPPQDLVDDLTAAWQASGGDLAQINATLVAHPALARTFRAKVRQPFDYLIAALRALGLTGAQLAALSPADSRLMLMSPLAQMGQPFLRPGGPDGWAEEAADWITPQALSARLVWALRIPARLVDPLPDPRDFLVAALGATASPALAGAVPRAESVREGVAIVLASADFNRR